MDPALQKVFTDLQTIMKEAEPFMAELAVSPDEFSDTRDIHTVSILYALAQEARKRELGQDVVIDYLDGGADVTELQKSNDPVLDQMIFEMIDAGLLEKANPT